MHVGIVGTGYVGLVTGACLAQKGNRVTLMDVDKKKLEKISKGKIPFYEPGLEDLVISGNRSGNLNFTSDMRKLVVGSEIIFIAVGTPQKNGGDVVDLTHVMNAAHNIGINIRDNKFRVVAVKSTVPPGSCDLVERTIGNALPTDLNASFAVASNPEFLSEGRAVQDFRSPDKIVIGVYDKQAADVLEILYRPFVRRGSLNSRIVFTNVVTSELIKYACNVFLANKVALTNEFSRLAETLNADIDDVRTAVGLDPRIGPNFLFPGPGYGGSCFPKDLRGIGAFASKLGVSLPIVDAITKSNEIQKYWPYNSLNNYYEGNIKDRLFTFWGVSFKPNTDDTRESPTIYNIRRILENGGRVAVYDPRSRTYVAIRNEFGREVKSFNNQYYSLKGSDGLVIMNDCEEFKGLDFVRFKEEIRSPVIFDSRNLYRLEDARKLGLDYISIGRPKVLAKAL